MRIGLSAPVLRTRDEPPFAQTVRSGAGLVMLANALYPALDPRHPASLSRPIVEGELRGRLRFAGVTVSDDLEANALKRYGDPGRLALGAAAGVDLLLYARSYDATEQRAAQALEQLPREQLQAGAERVLALRASLRPAGADGAAPAQVLDDPVRVADRLAVDHQRHDPLAAQALDVGGTCGRARAASCSTPWRRSSRSTRPRGHIQSDLVGQR